MVLYQLHSLMRDILEKKKEKAKHFFIFHIYVAVDLGLAVFQRYYTFCNLAVDVCLLLLLQVNSFYKGCGVCPIWTKISYSRQKILASIMILQFWETLPCRRLLYVNSTKLPVQSKTYYRSCMLDHRWEIQEF